MLGECRQKQVDHSPSQQIRERSLTLERTIAESSKELTVTGTPKGVHDGGFSGLRAAFFHPHGSSQGYPERDVDGSTLSATGQTYACNTRDIYEQSRYL